MSRFLRARILLFTLSACLAAWLPPDATHGAVVRVEIEHREPVAGGAPFGDAGPYERLWGRIHFGWSPGNRFNTRIVDLDKAPLDQAGLVNASANFVVLRPLTPPEHSVALVEVSNRGRRAALRYFCGATRNEPLGDGLLLRQGLTVIWVGWQCDVPDRPGLLRLDAPVATDDGRPIEGLVRCDWVVDEPARRLQLGHRGHLSYPVVEPGGDGHQLTERDGRLAPRRVVPRDTWRFSGRTIERIAGAGAGTDADAAFAAGRIYELVYRARDPKVVGLGLAVIRDVMSHARYDDDCVFGVERGVAFGVSQTGRFLRHFLYQGFNTDESGRPVYDGMLIHSAGAGRGSFNHRFAQPSRDAHRYSAFFYPTDVFPFSGRTQTDALTERADGLLAHAHDAAHLPRIFYTNTGYEYWGRAAALLHVTPDGRRDIEPLPNERIFHLVSGQHFVSPFPPRPADRIGDADAWRGNPLDFLVSLRALLVRMVEWVRDGRRPPDSLHPTIARGTLVPLEQFRFPTVPGLEPPATAHEAYRVDYGPRWADGVIDHQPPRLGPAFPVLVPAAVEDGNESDGVPTLERLAAIATYTSWCLRFDAAANPRELADFYGCYAPFPRTEAQKQATGDSRPSIESSYPTKDAYLRQVSAAADALVEMELMLAEDIPRVTERAVRHWDWIHER